MEYPEDYQNAPSSDVEKEQRSFSNETQDGIHYNDRPLVRKLLRWGVEARGVTISLSLCDIFLTLDLTGILPVPPNLRTDTQFSKIFYIWLSANLNILS
jgi:hypothetical protein